MGGLKGKRSGKVTDPTPFNGANPFKLSVQNLQGRQGEWPVLVDLQMRPENPTHLAYDMNVLDWPTGDVDGQIQHKANTTFADSNNPDISNPEDEAGSHGDMRLVPLLEVVMTGGQVPLKLTEPAATVIVGSGTALSSTVTLKPAANPADTRFTFTLPQGATLKVYEGTCPALGTLLATFPGSTDTIDRQTGGGAGRRQPCARRLERRPAGVRRDPGRGQRPLHRPDGGPVRAVPVRHHGARRG